MKKIGVAISGYNKLDEILTNINIIRNHWSEKSVFLSICCNDPTTLERLKGENIDSLVLGVDYKKDQFSEPKAWLRMRQYDTIKKSVLQAAKNSEYTIQWHSDAYALYSQTVVDMASFMKENNKLVAFRGKWRNDISTKRPVGHTDDHFILFNSSHVLNTNLLSEGDQVEHIKRVAGTWSCEGIMCYLISSHTPDENIWHYDDMRENIVDKKFYPENPEAPVDPYYKDGVAHCAIPPFNFDPNRKFLHSDLWSHTERFFKESGVPTSLIRRSEHL